MELLPILGFTVGAICLYFVPTIVSECRNHTSNVGIFVLNILFGWTGLGWGIALIWACSGQPRKEQKEYEYEEEYEYEYELEDDERECPICAETIKKKASICRYCSREII
jgi:hypothetical protein